MNPSPASDPARPAALAPDFAAAAERLRGELMAHCYRMMGSVQDAEDQVQETYLRAWAAFHGFEGRASLRTWLHTIATRACLTALERRGRRPLPTGLGAEPADPEGELVERPEVLWLEPIADERVGLDTADPEIRAATRETLRLAFVAALQTLTPQQRAVVVLRDALGFTADEAAASLETSVASANSALQRGRATLERLGVRGSRPKLPAAELADRERALLDQYMAAFERYDTDAVVALLREDATWEMPPFDGWYQGAAAIGRLIRAQCPAKGPLDLRLSPTRFNGQPACWVELRGEDGTYRPFQLHVLDTDGARVEHVGCFFDATFLREFAARGAH